MAKEYETPPTIGQLIAINNKLAKTQRDLQAENSLLRELVKYQHELPMNEAGDYDENVKWEKEATKALTQKGG